MSVSRRAGLPQVGQVDMLPGRMAVERIAGLVEGDVLGKRHRQVRVFGTGTTPHSSQWMTGIGQPQ